MSWERMEQAEGPNDGGSAVRGGMARRFPHDTEGFMADKDGLIQELERRAQAWLRAWVAWAAYRPGRRRGSGAL